MKRVFITGSTGALGRVLVRRLGLTKDKYQVFAPPRHSAWDSIDVRDHERMSAAIQNYSPELIIHLAADFSSDFSSSYAINVASSKALLEAAARLEHSPRVVLIGSAAEYGRVLPEDCPVSETSALRPVSIYGLTKAWQTELAHFYASGGVDVVVARIFNLCGEGLSERLFIGKIYQQFEQIRNGSRKKLEVGNLSAIRDYIAIPEAVEQLISIFQFGERGNVYHIGSGRPITMRDLLAQQLAAHNLRNVPVVEETSCVETRANNVPVIYADMSKTTALIASYGGGADA